MSSACAWTAGAGPGSPPATGGSRRRSPLPPAGRKAHRRARDRAAVRTAPRPASSSRSRAARTPQCASASPVSTRWAAAWHSCLPVARAAGPGANHTNMLAAGYKLPYTRRRIYGNGHETGPVSEHEGGEQAMATKRRKVSNPLALAVLAALRQGPMHPYEMATTMRSQGKERSIKLNFGSLYTVVDNLAKHGF